MEPTERDRQRFWEALIRATEAEPREVHNIRGASGLSHPVLAAGVDQVRRRLVMISGESDGRAAALAQADIQAAMSDVRVVMARPVAINLAAAARVVGEVIGTLRITAPLLERFKEAMPNKEVLEEAVERTSQFTLTPFKYAALNTVAAWKEVVQQLALIEMEASESGTDPASGGEPASGFSLGLERLAALDPSEYDRRMGVCTIPLYEFDPEEAEHFLRGDDVEAVRHVLRKHDVLQYFFPAADQLSLGLAERSPQSVDALVNNLKAVPSIGHPFGDLELVGNGLDFSATIDALQAKGLLVEGETGLEVTPAGVSARSVVKFKPREGVLSKIANILSIKVDLSPKDLFKP